MWVCVVPFCTPCAPRKSELIMLLLLWQSSQGYYIRLGLKHRVELGSGITARFGLSVTLIQSNALQIWKVSMVKLFFSMDEDRIFSIYCTIPLTLKGCPHRKLLITGDGWLLVDIQGSGCLGNLLMHFPPCHMSVKAIPCFSLSLWSWERFNLRTCSF